MSPEKTTRTCRCGQGLGRSGVSTGHTPSLGVMPHCGRKLQRLQLCAECNISHRHPGIRCRGLRRSPGGRPPAPPAPGGPCRGTRWAVTPVPVGALVLERDLDPQVGAAVAVVDHGHRPGDAGLLLVVVGMVVEREVDGFLHPPLNQGRRLPMARWATAGDVVGEQHPERRRPRPGSLSTSTAPPCGAVMAATIDRPSPVPPVGPAAGRVGAVEALEHPLGLLGGQARPRSVTSTATDGRSLVRSEPRRQPHRHRRRRRASRRARCRAGW